MDAKREALEIRNDLAVVDERRGRPFPQNLSRVRRVGIHKEIVSDLAPRDTGAEDVHAERQFLREAVPDRKGEVLSVGVLVGNTNGIGE